MTPNEQKHVLDWLTLEPCEKCGCTEWIIDGDGYGKFWLLCGGFGQPRDCIECRPLPENIEVVNG
jgi:hypothetical protein